MKPKFLEAFDWPLVLCAAALSTAGVLFIYSSGVNSQGVLVTNEWVKQVIWAGCGFAIMAAAALYDYKKTERFAQTLYIVFIAVLAYTLFFGRRVNGARSWIGAGEFGIQPSELGKIIFIMYMAKVLDDSRDDEPRKRFFKALFVFCVPAMAILAQPDMGTASVYIPIFLVMCFMAGIPFRYIFFILALGLGTVALTVLPVWNERLSSRPSAFVAALSAPKIRALLVAALSAAALIAMVARRFFRARKYFFWLSYGFWAAAMAMALSWAALKVLKTYQLERLVIFINPEVDRLGAGWNIINSKIAIGAGGLLGRGYLQGTQSHYRFLPQQSTDFIFSILLEETGFAGGAAVFALYMAMLARMLKIIRDTANRYGVLIASGAFAMFAFHFFINAGMVMGIMPITGIPLLFLSYGGSSFWSASLCLGVLMSVKSRKYE